jgi:hypothetical protein
MKKLDQDAFLQDREEEIIEFIKENSYCSKDSIFTKAKMPKSKATIELVNKLVSQNKISIAHTEGEKIRYYVEIDEINDQDDIIERLRASLKYYKYTYRKYSKFPELSKTLIKFMQIRIRVLEAERKHSQKVDLEDTKDIMRYVYAFNENPIKVLEMPLLDILSWAIKDDKYYLKHQLHSDPRENEYPFQQVKRRHTRRSIADLLAMKSNGRYAYGLKKADFEKHMKKLTENPHEWLRRFYAEKGRALYSNPPKLKDEIRKAILANFKPDTPHKKRWKKFNDEYKKSFPKFPIKRFFETLNDEEVNETKEFAKESGIGYDKFMAWINSKKYL